MTTELKKILSLMTTLTEEGTLNWAGTSRGNLEKAGLPNGARQHKSTGFQGGALHLLDFDLGNAEQDYSRSVLAYYKNDKLKIVYDAESSEIKKLLKAAGFQSPLVAKLEHLLTDFSG